jgi:hypothetical protein
VYLEGALERALRATGPLAADSVATPSAALETSVMNPFSVYRAGEDTLRRQLQALASWHLVNIIRAYGLSAQTPDALAATERTVLVELIVLQVREMATAGR